MEEVEFSTDGWSHFLFALIKSVFARALAVRVHFGCERVWDLSGNGSFHVEVHLAFLCVQLTWSLSCIVYFRLHSSLFRKFFNFVSMLNNVRRIKEELQEKHPKVGELLTKFVFYSRQLRDPKVKIRNINGGNRVAPSP